MANGRWEAADGSCEAPRPGVASTTRARPHRRLAPTPPPARRPSPRAVPAAGKSDMATLLQASWKRRSVQGKFQQTVGELMEINGLIEGLADKERDLEERQTATALKIEKAMKIAEMEEPPPRMPTDRDMADPKRMQASCLPPLRPTPLRPTPLRLNPPPPHPPSPHPPPPYTPPHRT